MLVTLGELAAALLHSLEMLPRVVLDIYEADLDCAVSARKLNPLMCKARGDFVTQYA